MHIGMQAFFYVNNTFLYVNNNFNKGFLYVNNNFNKDFLYVNNNLSNFSGNWYTCYLITEGQVYNNNNNKIY